MAKKQIKAIDIENVEENEEKKVSINDIFKNSENYDAQQEIISTLLNDTNLETKTDLDKPLRFSALSIVKDTLEQNQLVNSANLIENFMQKTFKFLISFKRQGRKEYIQALQSINSVNNEEELSNPLNPIQHIKK